MRSLICGLVVGLVLLCGALRIDTIRQERSLQDQWAKVCPKFWANPDVLKGKPELQMARTVCPEA